MTEYQFIADDDENKLPQEIVVLDSYKVEESKKTYNIELLGYMGQGRNSRSSHDEISLKNIQKGEG